jgi:Ran GTPase-activating protein (RanGAP) involved in mRNA processing and transport
MALLQNSQLTVLKLGYNNLGDEGVATLAEGIRQHNHLQSLDLGFNNVGDEGCRNLCRAIPSEGKLRTLYLAGNLIGEEGAIEIAALIRRGCSIEKLYLTGNLLGPDGVKAITEAVVEDEMRRTGEVEEQMLTAMADDPTEEKKMSNGGNQNISESARPGGVEYLFLGGAGLEVLGCQAIAQLLGSSSRLRVLSLPNCDIGDESLALLVASMKMNREQLRLESLQLSFNRITCRGIESLSNAIWGSTMLKELLLDNNEIADRGTQHIAAVLPHVQSLETLNIGFNQIKAAGVKLLMKAVVESSLLSLSVSGNIVDTSAAKSIASALAYNRTLVSMSLVHCSINHEGQRQIAAGVVSNSRIALRELTGFNVGPVIVTLGFPPALEHWNNVQILNFIHMMWEMNSTENGLAAASASPEEEERMTDPLHFLDDSSSTKSAPAPFEPAIVVDVAKKAYATLVAEGVDVFSRRPDHPNDSSFESPIAGDSIILEFDPSVNDRMPASKARSFVASPEIPKQTLPDPTRKKRIVEWLCANIQHINKLSQQPFDSTELWKLHQHYFTPVVNESGGSAVSSSPNPSLGSVALTASSVPEVSRAISTENDGNMMGDSVEAFFNPTSQPTMKEAVNELSSLPMLKRKVSYRFLGDAAVSKPRLDKRHATQAPSVSLMIEGGPGVHSMPPKTKRARRNRTRISFLPKIKAKLDSYLDVCHEKALVTMRQLYFVEQALLSGQVHPIDPATTRTHLCGDFAADASMIVVDMI